MLGLSFADDPADMRTRRLHLVLGGALVVAGCSATVDPTPVVEAGAGEPDTGQVPSPTPEAGPDATDATDASVIEDAAKIVDVRSEELLDAGREAEAAAEAEAGPALGIDCTPGGANVTASGDATHLGCTGLYASWPSRLIASDARAYRPGHELWSDGASKQRWIILPAGSRITTTDMDEWEFPAGTKLFKEFTLGGKKIETRMLHKQPNGSWRATVFVWSADESSAREHTSGVVGVNGTTYEIPATSQCMTCHMGRIDRVLGFDVIGLATGTGLNLAQLVAEGKLTVDPGPIAVPGDETARRALGWLHANCGTSCHNDSPSSLANATGLYMRLVVGKLGSVTVTDTYATSVNVRSNFQTSASSNLMRIAPGNVAGSAIPFRDGFRDDQGQGWQMPPIITHEPDTAAVAAVQAWVQQL
jgi:hypothetical protein